MRWPEPVKQACIPPAGFARRRGHGGDGQVSAEAAAEPPGDLPSPACSACRSASCGTLDPLAAACAADRGWSFLLAAASLSVAGGVGSPANAIALR